MTQTLRLYDKPAQLEQSDKAGVIKPSLLDMGEKAKERLTSQLELNSQRQMLASLLEQTVVFALK